MDNVAEASSSQNMPEGNMAATKKLSKLNKFIKKDRKARKKTDDNVFAQSMVQFAPLREGEVFPLVAQPADKHMNVIEWLKKNRDLIDESLRKHACILFRGFEIDGVKGFEAFAEAIHPGLYGKYGDLPKKESGKQIYKSTPYPEDRMILFHNESAHQDSWPRKQMFYCELPSPIGGMTPVVDCREMYRRLPDELREKFEQKGLLYVRTFSNKLDVPWQHFFKTEDRADVEARCSESGIEWQWLEEDGLQIRTYCDAVITHPLTGERSFFNQVQLHHYYHLDADVRDDLIAMFGQDQLPRHVFFGDGSPISDEEMKRVEDLYEECAVRFEWQQGDIVVVDNMLTAHARDPFEGNRKIVVAMGDMYRRSDLEAAEKAGQQAEENVVVEGIEQ